MRWTGVAVITSTPNPDRSSSSGIVMNGGRMLAGGAAARKPIMPPAAETLSMPSEGYGVSLTTWMTPRMPITSAPEPMIIRLVSAFWSGWRSRRQATRASMTGTLQASEPNTPRTNPSIASATAPSACRQITDASVIAPASTARPRPSLR